MADQGMTVFRLRRLLSLMPGLLLALNLICGGHLFLSRQAEAMAQEPDTNLAVPRDPAETAPPATGANPAAGSASASAAASEEEASRQSAPSMSLKQFMRAAGAIGGAIIVLSLTMVYFIVEHLLTLRRQSLIPPDLAKAVHDKLTGRHLAEAQQLCRDRPCLLGHVLLAGLSVADLGYQDVEKAMEDMAAEQSARLLRRMEYLQLIGTLAPMIGLLGTVWGMIQAFMEFEAKANPAVSELAPGVYQALVTTVIGLVVAVPAFTAFTILRNRVDELVAEAALTAEHVFVDFRRRERRG